MCLRRLLISIGFASAWLLAQVVSAWADEPIHIIQPGETLFRIALNHGVTVEALRAANGISGNLIYAGQTLTIPGTSAPPPVTESTTSVADQPVIAASEVIPMDGCGLSWHLLA